MNLHACMRDRVWFYWLFIFKFTGAVIFVLSWSWVASIAAWGLKLCFVNTYTFFWKLTLSNINA